jgi:hypothetical protein
VDSLEIPIRVGGPKISGARREGRMSDRLNVDDQQVNELGICDGKVVASRTFTVRCDTFFVPLDEPEKEIVDEIVSEHAEVTGRLGLVVYVDDQPVFIVSHLHYADHFDCGEFESTFRYLQDHIEKEITASVDHLWFEGQMIPIANKDLINTWSSDMAKLFKRRVAQRMKDSSERSQPPHPDVLKKMQLARIYPELLVKWQFAEIVYKSWQGESSKLRRLKIEPAGWKKRILEKYDDMPDDLLDQLANHPDEYSRKPAHLAAAHAARVCGFPDRLSYRRCMRIRQEGEALGGAIEDESLDGTPLEK